MKNKITKVIMKVMPVMTAFAFSYSIGLWDWIRSFFG